MKNVQFQIPLKYQIEYNINPEENRGSEINSLYLTLDRTKLEALPELKKLVVDYFSELYNILPYSYKEEFHKKYGLLVPVEDFYTKKEI